MQRIIVLVWVGICLGAYAKAIAGDQKKARQTAEVMTYENGAKLHYWFYQPPDKKLKGKKLPLILFLHGAGERGEDLSHVLRHGVPMLIDKGRDFPAYVISPQCPQKSWWPAGDMIRELDLLLKTVCNDYPIDRNRIYITGLSMGGMGTMAMVQTLPDRFAAAVQICGKGDLKKADKMVNVPMWFFHGQADKTVPVSGSTEMVEAIQAAGGTKVKLTTYPGVGHNSWTRTYNNDEMFEWMFKQSKGK